MNQLIGSYVLIDGEVCEKGWRLEEAAIRGICSRNGIHWERDEGIEREWAYSEWMDTVNYGDAAWAAMEWDGGEYMIWGKRSEI